ncbi:RNA helicase [Kytococcus sp. HMSC28H12]|uniref:DEAD/DEAH box helicase n=1 Tax=Kytococcus sp. HMSC28H12 TaxID=1581067 RepID=UPI0008A34DDC|nr:DEAD/DEAH box helicase [Kytococcus sp. HMSC28H12]OFS15264.1 DEAD/DEAH box helicase [Kytococcus sp. HMSC28H12]
MTDHAAPAPSETRRLVDRLPSSTTPDGAAVHEAFVEWATEQGIDLYPHQDEAALELAAGSNVILATPTGSGKSLVGVAGHFVALAQDKVSFYTAPLKALVGEKFFALVDVFGAENVGMMTGDAAVNPDAPIIACTAEILANLALREGAAADVGLVVMDEFHFYSEPDRGWAWQVPLLELPQAQFLLMSATLGDVSSFQEDLTRRTGRPTAVVAGAERPVPLSFEWRMTPLEETLTELLTTHQAPVYVVHFSQKQAVEGALALSGTVKPTPEQKAALAERLADVRFSAGFGKTLKGLLRQGIGVHHAGMLPRYRRLVEQLAQAGLLQVIAGTDTLGVGINVPIRTVLFTGLAKFDGTRMRVLKSREFHQIAGRAGRAGFDTSGHVVAQAPPHVIENARAEEKAGDDPKKRRKLVKKQPPEGFVSWTEETFDKLVRSEPEPLSSRMRVTHGTLLNVIQRPGEPGEAWRTMRRLVGDNHETAAGRRRLARRSIELYRGLRDAGVVTQEVDEQTGATAVRLAEGVSDDFALNQPLAPFAVAAMEVLDPESPTHALDVVSVIEAVLDDPRPVLVQQQFKARGEAVAEMKADGIEYTERMNRLEEITWPKPLEELLEGTLEIYRQSHPWVTFETLSPKSVVRDMFEKGASFGEYVRFYDLARAEGVLLRYLSDAWRTLRHTVPDHARTEAVEEVVEWLGEVIRQTDSSLVDEWTLLAGGEVPDREAQEVRPAHGAQGVTANERAFRVMVRTAMFRRVELVAHDRYRQLGELEEAVAQLSDPPARVVMDADAWDEALGAYYDEYEDVGIGPSARSAEFFLVDTAPDEARLEALPEGVLQGERAWVVEQVIEDAAGDYDWRITAVVDLDASDELGEAVVRAVSMGPATS